MLLHYRNTPHRMTGRTPSSLLMNREVKTKLPSFEQQTNDETETRKKDEEEKEKYTDKRRKASPRNLEVGNKVLVTQKHRNKFTTKFHPDPMVITKINGTQIVLKDKNGTQHRRNSSHVKLYQEIPDPEEEIQSDRKHDRQTESREENTEATQTETNQNTTETEIVLRRSTRNRKPDYLKGNYVALNESEINELSDEEYELKIAKSYETLANAGAHYVIDSIAELPPVIEDINRRLAAGERP
ncbi:Phosphonoacetaldehyde hydrolase [Paramuricea clavata]|uniref:Phosphonoacetaldehyde hydrolase n=1 Tax=Paramuricea clavata TaxID=317549 RepID=A0A7D9LKW1_PARCT|nr:Phosphonoacetaldehyde hydrolase [Paramuricea clavata]